MLIFIKNTPRAYAWGSRDDLPDLLGVEPTGEPQAELWLGDHPGSSASIAKARPAEQTLYELIESDPELYGVNGKHLPFLLKVLGIGAPLSLQVHPNKCQAEAGFAREEALGIARDAYDRSYRDDNHKPELLVALGDVTALCGFRPLADARADWHALAEAALEPATREVLESVANRCRAVPGVTEAQLRKSFLEWALSAEASVMQAVDALELTVHQLADLPRSVPVAPERLAASRALIAEHPQDAGVLISMLLHLVSLQEGEAIYLAARQLHAYLGGVAVEVMASSDNVLRAGFTEKHLDVAELLDIVDTDELASPLLASQQVAPGLECWSPGVPEFQLYRARVGEEIDCAPAITFAAPQPVVMVVVHGKARVARVGGQLSEFASVARGQSLYISAGEDIELTGSADVFLATVGTKTSRVS